MTLAPAATGSYRPLYEGGLARTFLKYQAPILGPRVGCFGDFGGDPELLHNPVVGVLLNHPFDIEADIARRHEEVVGDCPYRLIGLTGQPMPAATCLPGAPSRWEAQESSRSPSHSRWSAWVSVSHPP